MLERKLNNLHTSDRRKYEKKVPGKIMVRVNEFESSSTSPMEMPEFYADNSTTSAADSHDKLST